MSTIKFTITTPEREAFNDDIQMVIARTIEGDIGIMPGHENFIAPLDIGIIKVKQNDKFRKGVVSGGFIKVTAQTAVLLCPTFEWEDEIDMKRAALAEEKVKKALSENHNSLKQEELLKLKLKRALTRQSLRD